MSFTTRIFVEKYAFHKKIDYSMEKSQKHLKKLRYSQKSTSKAGRIFKGLHYYELFKLFKEKYK